MTFGGNVWMNEITDIDNRYQYNGKELNNDHGLGWYNYGARFYDAVLGRFAGVDPMADQFPYVSTYNYAENMVPNAIDLWGLQAVIVHGVRVNNERLKDNPDLIKQLYEMSMNSSMDDSFTWKVPRNSERPNKMINGFFPSDDDLTIAAYMLAEHTLYVRDKEKIPYHEHITIVAFSGGGPVGILAGKILAELGLTVNMITVNAPAAREGSKFHPSGGGLNDGLFYHTKGDGVPGRWLRGFKSTFDPESLEPQFEQRTLYSNGKDPFSKHNANNIDLEQIRFDDRPGCYGCVGPAKYGGGFDKKPE